MDLPLLALLLIGAFSVDAIGFDCGSKPDGDYKDPWADCSPTFYKCSAIGATIQMCPAGSVWDPQNKGCNYPTAVPQCSGQSLVPVVPFAPQANPILLPPAFPVQPQVIPPPAVIQPMPNSPTAGLISFSCNQNPTVTNSAPYFDCYQIANLRESLLAFDCIQKPGTQNGDSVSFDCYQKTVGAASAPIPIQCSRLSAGSDFTCSSGSGSGFGFSCRTSGTRKSPQEPLAFGCVHQSALASTPQTPIFPGQADVSQSVCTGKPPGNYPMARCDTRFWQCAQNGAAIATTCSSNQLRFDSSTARCLAPNQVPECGQQQISQFPVQSNAPSTDCTGKSSGNYPVARCDVRYYQCSNNGDSNSRTCSASQRFDSSTGRCLAPNQVPECRV